MPDQQANPTLPKAPTGIEGFDDLTYGGLPAGRPSLICGAAGCGKTLFATTFLVNGATRFDEPGVFMSFEERADDLAANVASLGYDLDGLVAAGKLAIDHVRVERSEIEETGEYDLEGLFIRLGFAVDSIGAKRVVLDTIETLFAGFTDPSLLRAELRRLFGWIKERGLTAVITGERGEGQLTRQGLEEYVSDCVVLLDNRVEDQITTRRLRVVKYRGSSHGTNEYPFLIDHEGISVLPVTSAELDYAVPGGVLSTGIAGLDTMLGPGGFHRGSSILISGQAGTGKTMLASSLADAACRRGERCLVFAFEESGDQIIRNARSLGLDLDQHVAAGRLRFEAARPSLFGLETHLARMHRDLDQFRPQVVVIDPISALRGSASILQATLLRMIDLIKARGITAVFTTLRGDGSLMRDDDLGVSSLMDAWIKLQNLEANGERTRTLYVMKARGMSHSNQIREFLMSTGGIRLVDAYIGAAGVLTGTARLIQETQEKAVSELRLRETERSLRDVARRRSAIERQIEELRAGLDAAQDEEERLRAEDRLRAARVEAERQELTARRSAAE
ncbi:MULTISPECIES: circadian clock protein KaiC [Methylobacterium]|uniref:non-specific serine/threonine protein kinase n=1 Tax=Methylobacterium longum TaxID=767694 RepID=A0ABT8AJX8_9HYPH|nr:MULTISPECIES: circadian clock protein KaiC [Methylobacterium]MCJ2101171.1 circadian clock protein KaiC [Methylobacterium sp. E-046]MDN3570063.1 circadian clock protein KaiC [Methylobacterium longum]GJE14429.1 Circadian clock protein kinase KaiC [Methylobacterium longum]